MNEKHLFTKEEKIQWWGVGEWAEEPDFVDFIHNGIECRIIRMAAKDGPKGDHIFGGYLCGYIKVPKDNIHYAKSYDDIHIDVHYGLTYGAVDEENSIYLTQDGHWIGFDCGHSGDLIPSMEMLFTTRPEMIEIRKNKKDRLAKLGINSIFFDSNYRNMNFCIQECKSMAEQILLPLEASDDR